jgi:hypothetical protein
MAKIANQRPRQPSHRALRLLRIVTPLALPLLLVACYAVGQPHRRKSSRRIQPFRRNRRLDRDGLACISGIVEWPFFHFLEA